MIASYHSTEELKLEREKIREEISALDRKIIDMKERRQRLGRDLNILTRYLYEPNSGVPKGGTSDPYAVPTNELASVLDRWIEKNGRGAINVLCIRSGISRRRIFGIRERETKFTIISVAQSLLEAMGLEDLLDSEIRVIPNPRYNRARYDEDDC